MGEGLNGTSRVDSAQQGIPAVFLISLHPLFSSLSHFFLSLILVSLGTRRSTQLPQVLQINDLTGYTLMSPGKKSDGHFILEGQWVGSSRALVLNHS